MKDTDKDYTGKLGQLYTVGYDGKPYEWAMYSFSRVSSIFWNAFANKLRKEGKSDEKIKEILQHRDMRHMLDNDEDKIAELAEEMAKKFC
jgi:phage pi2 protein 07